MHHAYDNSHAGTAITSHCQPNSLQQQLACTTEGHVGHLQLGQIKYLPQRKLEVTPIATVTMQGQPALPAMLTHKDMSDV
jgi:hypothetical protein